MTFHFTLSFKSSTSIRSITAYITNICCHTRTTFSIYSFSKLSANVIQRLKDLTPVNMQAMVDDSCRGVSATQNKTKLVLQYGRYRISVTIVKILIVYCMILLS